MAKLVSDQADGLRKLAGQGGVQIISIVSGSQGAGKTVAATNLASALSRAGRVVKVISAPAEAGSYPGIATPARSTDQACTVPDIILIDPPSGSQGDFQDIDRTEIVIVLQPDSKSITSSYGLLKQLSGKYGIDRFHLLLNQVATAEQCGSIANNFADAAGRFLGVAVDYLGYIPRDPQLEKAARLRKSVVEAFPIADSAAQFRRLADKLIGLPRLSSLNEVGEAMQRTVMGAAC